MKPITAWRNRITSRIIISKIMEQLVRTSPKRRRKRKYYVKPMEFLIFGDAPHVSKIIEVKEI